MICAFPLSVLFFAFCRSGKRLKGNLKTCKTTQGLMIPVCFDLPNDRIGLSTRPIVANILNYI